MGALLTLIVPALVPALADGFRGILARITGGKGALPQNIDEQIKLMNAQTEALKAVAALDIPTGTISQWVADLRAAFRYVAAGVIILSAAITLFVPVGESAAELAWSAAEVVFGFMFGDRMYSYLRRGK